ncbi:hypothetical protein CNYM01_11352 [Colletotrichum nymphaeae SA-01]|uniref:Uncharacterized protein n=1 Tax=Colletotrichum nymphaeae SA-01 TaxID=1460502 RepID=A0A135SSG3_9PEZI|nr:hypothetical protein CNYM01_11352 [Colletotrichum nymphaeae SA-01]
MVVIRPQGHMARRLRTLAANPDICKSPCLEHSQPHIPTPPSASSPDAEGQHVQIPSSPAAAVTTVPGLRHTFGSPSTSTEAHHYTLEHLDILQANLSDYHYEYQNDWGIIDHEDKPSLDKKGKQKQGVRRVAFYVHKSINLNSWRVEWDVPHGDGYIAMLALRLHDGSEIKIYNVYNKSCWGP